MSALFIHIYLDEDVNVLLERLLTARGYSATTTAQAGQCGRTDDEQLRFATAQGMCIITHNRVDFEILAAKYFATGENHAGIIVAVRRPAHDMAHRLVVLLDDLTADEMVNQVRYI